MILKKLKEIFRKSDALSGDFSGKSVLTIEDDATQRQMISGVLGKKGYRVLMAGDGREGIELAKAQRPDLILLDVVMPQMGGHEVCKKLKSNDQTKNIPVIFLTSVDAPKDVIEHFSLGAENHLTKPIGARELIEQVENILEEK